jgi:hypothetical protein
MWSLTPRDWRKKQGYGGRIWNLLVCEPSEGRGIEEPESRADDDSLRQELVGILGEVGPLQQTAKK